MKAMTSAVAFGASLIVLLVGCGGNPSNEVSTSPTVAAPPSASAQAPSQAPGSASSVASPAAIASASPANLQSLPSIFSSHADAGLEAQLPAEVSGTAMGHYSISFSDVLDAGGDRASIDAFLAGVGKTEADGSFAVAVDPTNTLGGGIFAFKVNGLDTASLLAGIVAVEQADLDGATTRQGTVGGKSVTILSRGTGPNDTEWIYGRGDVVFVIHAPDETGAAAFLQALP